jgi:hypothetical protein
MNEAHGMRLEHPIFKGPLVPKIDLTDIKTPSNYRDYPEGKNLPDKLKAWKVHSGEFAMDGTGVDVGLVSHPDITEAPDGEWISGGVNSKGPNSLAIGRHGNLFLWGFYGAPDRMTESAKRVFLNSICYIKQFDGQTPLVARMPGSGPRWMLDFWPGFLRNNKDPGEPLMKHLRESVFPPEAMVDGNPTADSIEKWLNENLEYVRFDKKHFVVDEDAKSLGVSNRKIEFFDAVGARLAKDPKDALAARLLERYAPDAPRGDANALEKWVAERKASLRFTDAGGYRWVWLPPRAATTTK